MSDCNCNPPSTENEYLLVKATASQASVCGTALESTTSIESCAKQEPMYDVSLSDFLVPLESSSVNMIVCNPEIYTTGMWLEFLSPVVTLKITAIVNNALTLVNRCDSGDIVSSNPAVGVIVAKGSHFTVVGQPECVSSADFLLKVISSLATATELCLPALVTSSATSVIHPVGRVESDPSNLSAGKCLKKIFGILFNAGRPFLSGLGSSVGHNNLNYRRLVKHKTSGGVYEKENYSEAAQLESGKQYLLAITNSEEKIFGPTYITKFHRHQLKENTTDKDHLSWPTFSGSYEEDFDLGDFAGLTPPAEAFLDHYYVMCRLEIGCSRTGADVETIQAELNGIRVGRCVGATSADYLVTYNAITIPVRVENSNDKLTLRLTTNGTTRYYFRLHVDGIYY
jgi:hypothetical protein